MRTPYNRFAIFPFCCRECHRYIWLEPYTKAEVYRPIAPFVSSLIKEKICKDCLPKFDIKHISGKE